MRRRRAPMNRKINLRARRRVGSNPNVVGPIGTSHRHPPINADCPPRDGPATTIEGFFSMAEPRLNTTVVSKRRASVAFKVYGAILTPGQPSSLRPIKLSLARL